MSDLKLYRPGTDPQESKRTDSQRTGSKRTSENRTAKQAGRSLKLTGGEPKQQTLPLTNRLSLYSEEMDADGIAAEQIDHEEDESTFILPLHSELTTMNSRETADDAPATVPFLPRLSAMMRPRHTQLDSITRARILHENRLCPYCGHATTEPIELRTMRLDSTLMPVPGEGTLVGFVCDHCEAEWPI